MLLHMIKEDHSPMFPLKLLRASPLTPRTPLPHRALTTTMKRPPPPPPPPPPPTNLHPSTHPNLENSLQTLPPPSEGQLEPSFVQTAVPPHAQPVQRNNSIRSEPPKTNRRAKPKVNTAVNAPTIALPGMTHPMQPYTSHNQSPYSHNQMHANAYSSHNNFNIPHASHVSMFPHASSHDIPMQPCMSRVPLAAGVPSSMIDSSRMRVLPSPSFAGRPYGGVYVSDSSIAMGSQHPSAANAHHLKQQQLLYQQQQQQQQQKQ
eukprot:GDKJ01063035.1.p1 GENE.GDKJ01063035.1~~GDKJ01063035.1.p1  ORF type:complete len:261 (+),score=76.15 GDKJ01063035.1:195-977(+)